METNFKGLRRILLAFCIVRKQVPVPFSRNVIFSTLRNMSTNIGYKKKVTSLGLSNWSL